MTPWEILKKAENGSVNFGNVFNSQKADRKRNITIAQSLVKDIYSGNRKTQITVLIVSIVTGIAIISQAIIAYRSHQLSKEKPKLEDLLLIDSTLQIQQVQLNQTKTILDSLKSEHHILSTRIDSTSDGSIK